MTMHVGPGYTVRRHYAYYYQEDMQSPITVGLDDATSGSFVNDGYLLALQSAQRRIRLRIQPEVWVHNGKRWQYKRLIKHRIAMTLPNADQTHALLAMLRDILSQLDGRLLDTGAGRPAPPDPVPSSTPPPPSSGSESRPGGTSDDASSPQNFPPK